MPCRILLALSAMCWLTGCGGNSPESLNNNAPKSEYAEAVKAAADQGVMVSCDGEGEVVFLDFHNHPDVATAVAHVANFPALKMLNFSSSGLTDADMAPIAAATNVEELGLHGTQITDQALAQLSKLTKLRQLNLTDTGIGDAGLAHLSGLESLVRIDLQSTNVTDEGLKHLEPLTNLVYIQLSNSQVTDEGAKQLKEKLANAEIINEKIIDRSHEPLLPASAFQDE